MIYSIVYDAVRKKAQTSPSNEYIGNVEMAAAIGIILKELKLEMDFSDIEKPKDIKKKFLSMVTMQDIKDDDMFVTMYKTINKYKVKDMVNENMQDLENLVKYNTENLC